MVDGSGGPRKRADVGIAADRIVAIGTVLADAHRTIDATGKVVAPGFVDVHTHYDAQVFWDGALTPSSLHGFTSVFAGNCGFTIAPLPEEQSGRDYLMRMLARVEAIPLESLELGVPWNWRSTAEYLDAIEGGVALNLGFMVGHSALRRCAMGEDAARRPATTEEQSQMKRLLAEGIEAGAMGLSSSWARTHNDGEGNMVPSRHAERDELIELCRVVAGFEGTSIEFIPMVGDFEPWAIDLMAEMSAASQRVLNWNLLTVTASGRERARKKLRAGDIAAERGGRVVALTMPITLALRLSFATGFILDAFPDWEHFMRLPVDEKAAILSDPEQRAALAALAAGPDNRVSRHADWANHVIYDVCSPANEPFAGRRVGDIAAEEGREPFDVLCDLVVADDLQTSFGIPAPEETRDDWSARSEVWRHERAVIGGSDAGAHVDVQAAFNYPTRVLAEAVREHGVVSLEEAVHLLSDAPARLYGLRQRGRLEPGWFADVVVLDPMTVASEKPRMVRDLPGGAARVYAGSTGIEHVLVNGQPVVTEGKVTADRPGTVLRSGRDTATSSW